jgi:peptidyl-prolyl cis-trans isomerase B (cyclophilin B)
MSWKPVLGSLAALALLLAACSETTEERRPDVAAQADGSARVNGEIAVIEVKDLGTITLEFYPGRAPNHVDNFKKLAREGFYDGTKFHRVIPGFMIQGGDPNTKGDDTHTWGTGGPGYEIDAEFSDAPHLRGTLSMARSQDPNSAGSQFFICVDRAASLDGEYTVFGKVLEGMDVADKIVNSARDGNDRPNEDVVIESIRIESAS